MLNESEPTAATLADKQRALIQLRLRRRRAELAGGGVVAVGRGGVLPLSWQQVGLWFLYQLDPGASTYHMPLVLRLDGELDVVALAAAVRAVVARHEGLRTRFVMRDGTPGQLIDPPPAVVSLPVVALPAVGWQSVVEAEVARPFRLLSEPGFRWWLGRLADGGHVVVLNCHHILTDGWSVGILTADLSSAYQQAVQAGGSVGDGLLGLAPLAVQPADYAVWQQRHPEQLRAGLEYWATQLADLPTLQLPSDRPRPAAPTGAGAGLGTTFDPTLTTAITTLANRLGTGPIAVLLAGLNLVLHRYTGESDLAVGTIFSGRTRSELEPLVGFFAGTVVLRTDVSGDPVGGELVRRCSEVVLGASAHQDVPFGTVVEELKPERVPGQNPLFQVAMSLVPAAFGSELRFGGLTAAPVGLTTTSSRFDLSLQITQHPDDTMTLWAEYSTELFDPERISALTSHLHTALTALTTHPDQPVSTLDIVSAAEHDRIASWNPVPVDLGTGGLLLQELVAGVAARFRDAVAVRFEGRDTSYAELEERANRLAWLLQAEHGVGPERVVGVLLDRGPALVQAELAVLKAGGAWLPLDAASPAGRIGFQVADAGVAVVVVESALVSLVPAGVACVVVDDTAVRQRLDSSPTVAPPCPARPDNGAYLIYTSGSTGTPKGVLVPHRAAVNFIGSVGELFWLGPGDRVLQFANPAFDVSVFDLYAALAHGATVVAAPRSVLHDVDQLADLLRRERVTVADIPPAVLGLLDPETVPDLRALFVGLEAFPAELVNRWRTAEREFHNGYGPTEATVACVDYSCPPEPLTGPPPIGRAMANMRAYVLDPAGNLAPIGVPGELHIAGVGLARGYLGRPGLTAERFLPCPFGPPGERMYATGDIVVWSAAGQLSFLGRADRQVKIRGLRIELGEIEHALAAFPGIQQAAVVVTPTAPGGPRLDAYLVLDRDHAEAGALDTAALLTHLSSSLPLHMIPATFTVLDALPLNANGKLDQQRLPAPTALHEIPHQPPATETERILADIWHQLLNLPTDQISRHDNFFQLGGSSLVVMRVISRIRQALGVEITVVQAFRWPVLCDLATEVDRAAASHALSDADLIGIDAQLDAMSDEEVERMLAREAGGQHTASGPATGGVQ